MAKKATTKKRTPVRKQTAKAPKKKPTRKTNKVVAAQASQRSSRKLLGRNVFFNKNTQLTANSLRTWHKWLAVLYGVAAVAVFLLSTTQSFSVTTGFWTADPLLSNGNNTVLAAATQHLFDLNIAFILAAALFVTALTHVVLLTKYRQQYASQIAEGVSPGRWIGYGGGAALIIVTLALLSGLHDMSALGMLVLLVGVVSVNGYLVERKPNDVMWPNVVMLLSAGTAILAVIGMYLGSAIVHGSGDVQSFIYWIYGGLVVLAVAFAANMTLSIKRTGNYAYIERNYMLLHLLLLLLVVAQTYTGMLRP